MSQKSDIKVLIAIPTFNNQGTLRSIVEETLKTGLPVLVVNDGSTDGSQAIVADLPIAKINFLQNQGKGEAIRTAIKWAQQQSFTHIITIDADGQHVPADVKKFLPKIEQNPMAIIVGKRDFTQANIPSASQFGRKFSNFWIKMSCGINLSDSQSGFRTYPVLPLAKIKCFSKRYDYEIEVLVRSAWAGLDIESIDISVVYSEKTKQASHFRPLLDNMRISKTFAWLVTRNLIPWPHKMLFGVKQNDKFKYIFLNPFKSIKTLLTERTSVKEISFAVMVGIFLGTLPLIGMHCIAILFVATRLRLNRIIAMNVSHLCAPPIVPAMAIELGYLIRKGHFLTEFTMQTLGNEALQRIQDYLLGSILLAPILGIVAGLVTYFLAFVYQKIFLRLKTFKKASRNAKITAS